MRLRFRIVDVFTDRPFAGNQLCVVPEGSEVPASLMQAVALEIGFSETTFVTETTDTHYEMRIFTPSTELSFAGHPSLGTAFVLASEGLVSERPLTQRVRAGDYPMDVDLSRATVRMGPMTPEFGPEEPATEALAASIGLSLGDVSTTPSPQVVSVGFRHLMVGVRDVEAVARAFPNPTQLGEVLGKHDAGAVYLFSVLDSSADGPSRAKARLFAPEVGLTEDAATGSAGAPLGAYLLQNHLIPPGRLAIAQGEEMGRPSTLFVDVDELAGSIQVTLSGQVMPVAEGHFDLPD